MHDVIQADRDFAAELVIGGVEIPRQIRAGELDSHYYVQRAAAHRRAPAPPPLAPTPGEEMERLWQALAQYQSRDGTYLNIGHKAFLAALAIDRGVRS